MKPPRRSLAEELRREAIDDASRRLRQAFQEWDNWLIQSNCGVVEQYVKYDSGVHVHGFAKWRSNAQKFCLVFRSERNDPDAHPRICGRDTFPHLNAQRRQERTAHYYSEGVVLIGVRELVEFPKGITLEVGTSMVRLQALDECLSSRGDADYMSCPMGEVVRALREDGEALTPTWNVVVPEHQLIHEMIQGRPEVTDNLPDDHAEDERDLGNRRHLCDILSGLVIVVADGVRADVFVEERLDSLIQIDEVMVGPVELGPAIIKRMDH